MGGTGGVPASKTNAEHRLARHDLKVARAIVRREAGEQLKRHERWLLAFEDADMTPEAAAACLADAVKQRGARGILGRVAAVQAMTKILGDEAPEQHDHRHTLTLDGLVGRGEAPLTAQAVAAEPSSLLPGGAELPPVAGAGTNPRRGRKTNGKRNGRKRRGSNGARRRKK